MSGIFYGFIGGVIAWIATEFIARPFRQFLHLRSNAANALIRFEQKPAGAYKFTKQNAEASIERRKAYDECGTELIAFSYSNSIITRIFHRFPIKKLRVYPRNAGTSLRALAGAAPDSSASNDIYETIMLSLKLKYRP